MTNRDFTNELWKKQWFKRETWDLTNNGDSTNRNGDVVAHRPWIFWHFCFDESWRFSTFFVSARFCVAPTFTSFPGFLMFFFPKRLPKVSPQKISLERSDTSMVPPVFHSLGPRKIPKFPAPDTRFGTFALWFGWYGFNPGSTLTMKSGTDGALAAQVAMNTTLAAAAGECEIFGSSAC